MDGPASRPGGGGSSFEDARTWRSDAELGSGGSSEGDSLKAARRRSSIGSVHTWMWLVLLGIGLIKIPIAGLMLWLPFRSDAALQSLPPAESAAADSSGEDDGGSKTLPGAGRVGPHRPRAPLGGRGPRRGPHDCPAGGRAAPPARVRTARRGVTRVTVRR